MRGGGRRRGSPPVRRDDRRGGGQPYGQGGPPYGRRPRSISPPDRFRRERSPPHYGNNKRFRRDEDPYDR